MEGKALMNKFGPAYRNAGLPEGVKVYQCQTPSGGFSEAGHKGDLFQQQTAEAERRFGISPLDPTAGGQ